MIIVQSWIFIPALSITAATRTMACSPVIENDYKLQCNRTENQAERTLRNMDNRLV